MSTHIVEIKAREKHRIVRERMFSVTGLDITPDVIASILLQLRGEHATGRMYIDLSQGCPHVIQFEENAKISS